MGPDGVHGAVGSGVALAQQLTMLRDAVAALTNVPPESLEVGEATAAHDELRSLCDRIRVFSARLLSHVEADGRWASSGGSRTFPEWVARRAGASVGAARREAALGRALTEDLPATRAAAGAGRISLEHAQVLTQLAPTSDVRRAVLASDRTDRNEEFLVGAATRMGVDDYRRAVRRWAAAVDEAAHEAEHLAAEAKEYLYVTPRRDGMDVQGFLTAEHGDVLVTALRAMTGVPAADDTRTPDQRRAAALTGLAHLVLDKGLVGGGGALVRPHISVHVSWETMQRLDREHAEHGDAAAERPPRDRTRGARRRHAHPDVGPGANRLRQRDDPGGLRARKPALGCRPEPADVHRRHEASRRGTRPALPVPGLQRPADARRSASHPMVGPGQRNHLGVHRDSAVLVSPQGRAPTEPRDPSVHRRCMGLPAGRRQTVGPAGWVVGWRIAARGIATGRSCGGGSARRRARGPEATSRITGRSGCARHPGCARHRSSAGRTAAGRVRLGHATGRVSARARTDQALTR